MANTTSNKLLTKILNRIKYDHIDPLTDDEKYNIIKIIATDTYFTDTYFSNNDLQKIWNFLVLFTIVVIKSYY